MPVFKNMQAVVSGEVILRNPEVLHGFGVSLCCVVACEGVKCRTRQEGCKLDIGTLQRKVQMVGRRESVRTLQKIDGDP